MQVAESVPQTIATALDSQAQLLQAAGTPAAAIARALAAARITAQLSDDAQLAMGVLLHESDAQLIPLPTGFDPRHAALAKQLAELGEFAKGARWENSVTPRGSQAEVLRKMLLAVASDPKIIVARIAIQLARLRLARESAETDQRALALEARAVFAPLANRLGIWQLKWELEDLAFRYLEPDEYRQIAATLAERRRDREAYVADFSRTLGDALHAAGIEADVQGRAKHIYSIHRKLLRKQRTLERLYDLRAVRVICSNVAECYAALGVVHGSWQYIPGEFDDYIATPKENNYRSIHTAVIGPREMPVEVQIRTREMHEHAELGVAAHWRYKEGIARDVGYERKIEWIRNVLDPERTNKPLGDGDFIDRVRSELFEDRIYALTPRGEVIDLPKGATALDFAYAVHTSLGHRCRGAKANGRIVPLNQALANGAVVEIITTKHEQPSRDWLIQDGFLVSPRSRAKLRSWFRRIDASENESAGRTLLERELARLSVGLDAVPALASELKASDAAQLYRWLGEGEVSMAQLTAAVERRGVGPSRDETRAPPLRPKSRRQSTSRGPISAKGVGDLPITLARCCAPVPPVAVLGYLTVGRGVTVHAATCSSLRRMRELHPQRCLQVDWRLDATTGVTVELTVIAWDRRGLVRDISEALANARLSIEALSTVTDRANGTATTVLRTSVQDLAALTSLLRTLARIDQVISAKRSA